MTIIMWSRDRRRGTDRRYGIRSNEQCLRMKTNFIIVLNDNQMSISENVGGMNQYLNSFRTSDAYLDLKDGVTNSLNRIPVVGEPDGQTDPERQKRYQTVVCSGNVFLKIWEHLFRPGGMAPT